MWGKRFVHPSLHKKCTPCRKRLAKYMIEKSSVIDEAKKVIEELITKDLIYHTEEKEFFKKCNKIKNTFKKRCEDNCII